MFQKFAKLDVLEVKSAPTRVRSASLSKFADFSNYRTDDGYIYVRVRAISSRVNKNHDGWPAAELKKSYQTFIGKPIFVDHHNSDPKKARGVIVDAKLHVEDAKTSALDPYYANAPSEHLPATWIELLLEVDAKRFPKLAKAIINGEIDGVSMGANVERSVCSHCKNEAHSPEEYCSHVRSKGAYFDVIDQFGAKVSKRSYEDCYDIGFFEISFVFDPADQTALVSDVRKSHIASAIHREAFNPGEVMLGAPLVVAAVKYIKSRANGTQYPSIGEVVNWLVHSNAADPFEAQEAAQQALQESQQQMVAKTADAIQAPQNSGGRNSPPQSEMMSAPEKVDTLRQDQTCPICGSDMEDGVCEVCNYEEPPEGFDNPDLEKAKQVDNQMRDQDAQQAAQGMDANTPNDVQPGPGQPQQPMPSGAMPMAASTGNKFVAVTVIDEKTSAAGGRINTQERPILPVTRKVTDKPLNSKTVTDSSKPVESNTRKEKMSDKTKKIADGATPQGTGVQAEKRVDVEGVGGVSGDPLNGIKHENVEKAMEQKGGPSTDTWSGNEGDALGQHEPVSSDGTDQQLGGPIGSPVSHVKEGDFPGGDGSFPDHEPSHVDLQGALKEETGEGTATDPNEQFRSQKHADPVTQENANEVGGPMGTPIKAPLSAYQAATNAVRLADTEVELGLIRAEAKWDRIAELEDADPAEVAAELRAYAKVKTARTAAKTAATTKTAGATSMPSLRPMTHVAGFDPAEHGVEEVNVEDSLW